LETALHVSGGTITHHQEHKQLYLQHLIFVTPLLLSAAIVEDFGTGLSVLWVAYATHSTLKPVSTLKTSLLILFERMVAVDCKNLTKHARVYKVPGKHVDYLNTITGNARLNTVLTI
jgi:hypothetical protein